MCCASQTAWDQGPLVHKRRTEVCLSMEAKASILAKIPISQRRPVAAWPPRRFRLPLLSILKIHLPALNDGAGRERLFVLDRADKRGQLVRGHAQASRRHPRGVVTFRGRQF